MERNFISTFSTVFFFVMIIMVSSFTAQMASGVRSDLSVTNDQAAFSDNTVDNNVNPSSWNYFIKHFFKPDYYFGNRWASDRTHVKNKGKHSHNQN
ncbi:hypothetical protein MKW94_019064 [Papaver nudicaule]|uniref:Uncharacterized protein n=1 Tax=Papaver nudicaule TaxID=74823 RepID=A0AA41S2B3_PAPNU|nr:hypothetical protein [Papaver nudicaule]